MRHLVVVLVFSLVLPVCLLVPMRSEAAAAPVAAERDAGKIEMGSLSSAPEGGPEEDWSLNAPESEAAPIEPWAWAGVQRGRG